MVTYLFQQRCYRSLVIWNVCICILHCITLFSEVKKTLHDSCQWYFITSLSYMDVCRILLVLPNHSEIGHDSMKWSTRSKSNVTVIGNVSIGNVMSDILLLLVRSNWSFSTSVKSWFSHLYELENPVVKYVFCSSVNAVHNGLPLSTRYPVLANTSHLGLCETT